MPKARFRTSTRGYMRVVLAFALIICCPIAWVRARTRAWAEMYHQREVTMAIMQEAEAGIGFSREVHSGVGGRLGNASDACAWSAEVGARKASSFRRRVRASGSLLRLGRFITGAGLEPITVEVYDPIWGGPWLARLLRDYDEKGWSYKVVKPPGVGSPGR